MTTADHTIAPSYGLLRAAEAVTNWRALAMAALASLAFFLSIALSGWLTKSSVLLGGLFGLLSLIVGLIGYSSVGIVLMRNAQDQHVGLVDAILQAVFTVHRLLGVAVMLMVGFIVLALTSVLILVVCKVPGIGPLLYSFVFVMLTVLLGGTIAGLFYVVFPLAAPAIWSGNTTWETSARMLVIIRQRLLPVMTKLVMLSLLVFFLSCVVSFVLFTGYSATLGLSSAVGINPVGGAMNFQRMLFGVGFGGMGSMGAFVDEMPYSGSFAFASGLLMAVGMVVPFLTFINGSCLIYLQTIDGLQFGEAEQQLRGHVGDAVRRAQEARERAGSKLQEARGAMQKAAQQSDTQTMPKPPSPETVAARTCTACHAPLAEDDGFCGECGAANAV